MARRVSRVPPPLRPCNVLQNRLPRPWRRSLRTPDIIPSRALFYTLRLSKCDRIAGQFNVPILLHDTSSPFPTLSDRMRAQPQKECPSRDLQEGMKGRTVIKGSIQITVASPSHQQHTEVRIYDQKFHTSLAVSGDRCPWPLSESTSFASSALEESISMTPEVLFKIATLELRLSRQAVILETVRHGDEGEGSRGEHAARV